MFAFLKNKNAKRPQKREALNVKTRAGEIRARRVRFLGTLLCLCLTVFVLVMFAWKGVDYIMREAVYTNPRLAIDTIDIETDGVLAPEKIREWARVKKGNNLLSLDLTRLKRDLELHPIIESAAAEKILPRHLRITVTERKPVAVVYLYQAGAVPARTTLDRLYLDAAGMVIPPLLADERSLTADPNPSKLPVLTGFNARELRPGFIVESANIRAALDLLVEYEKSPVASVVEFRAVDLSSAHTLLVTAGQSEITFATDNFSRQLSRLYTTLDYARRESRSLATLDLAVGNYVPARWLESSTNSPAATPLPAKLLKPQKKHV